jgi:hypothetical protein
MFYETGFYVLNKPFQKFGHLKKGHFSTQSEYYEYALNSEIGFGIVILCTKYDIPKNPFIEYGLCFNFHFTKVWVKA